MSKAVRGHPAIAQAMLDGGAAGLAEARLSNVQRLRTAGMTCPITLIRTPMLSQVDHVVQMCETSYNTEPTVMAALAAAAIRHGTVHGIILMVEMGDKREGIIPHDLVIIAQQVMDMPGVALKGIGANFGCLSGIAPTAVQMRALSDLGTDVEGQCGPYLQTVSGGNSTSLPWAFGQATVGRINDLRIGEAILLGVDPITGAQIDGLFQDAFTLVAEVVETDRKPLSPSARRAMAGLRLVPKGDGSRRIILAIGDQDTNAAGLTMPPENTLIGATSDHLVIRTQDATLRVGAEMRFEMNYAALMRAMAAPDIQIVQHHDTPAPNSRDAQGSRAEWALV
ncbi:putative amino acid racemase [Rubricella aquisinus]|uniref:Putative amino acid racemase n=1 Tax=Rubricella aquisinus TaxID=2028108 RepID=A0A840WYD1_9RHOB|nr:putative amino acid racemase [Rubricella aquisinus]